MTDNALVILAAFIAVGCAVLLGLGWVLGWAYRRSEDRRRRRRD